MTWSDIPFKPTTKALRQFAGAWLIFFLAFGAHQYLARRHPSAGLALMGVAIRWLVSLLMLLLMFYGIITPVAVLFWLRGRDLLRRKPDPHGTTFWMPKDTPQSVHSYFRQY